MPEKAVISHRGEKYEIGRGKRFYGIWVVGAPYDAPVDRWPENRDGWQQAWARFAAIEVPGTIAAVTRERPGLGQGLRQGLRQRLERRRAQATDSPLGASVPGAGAPGAGMPGAGALGHGAQAGPRRIATALLAGEGLLVLGVVLGLAGLFPAYEGSQSLLSQSDQVVPHLCYVIGWALTAALVALSVVRPSNAARLGALFGLGLSAVTFGFFLADLGEAFTGISFGSGLVVSLLSWLACTVGSVLVLASAGRSGQQAAPVLGQQNPGQPNLGQPNLGQPNLGQPRLGWPTRPGRGHAGPLALLVLAGIGTAAAFAPSWDSYVLSFTSTETAQTITAGNAFDNPGVVIAGNVAVMVAIVAVAALAALWRPARQGALLLAGAIVPLIAEAISALIQVGQPATPAMFGISSSQASAAGLTISAGVTPIFWVFFVFVISLLVSCAWLFTEPQHPAMPGIPAWPWPTPGGEPGTGEAAGASVSEDTVSDGSEDAESDDVDSNSGTEGGEESAYA